MTATADYLGQTTSLNGIVHTLDSGRVLMRTVMRIGACVFLFLAFLIWLTPVGAADSQMMLVKLAVSSLSVLASAGCWHASLPAMPPSVEIDIAEREVRLVRDGARESQRIIERCCFDQLHEVELNDRVFMFWAKGGRLLAEVTLSNATAHAVLLHALRSAGKIA